MGPIRVLMVLAATLVLAPPAKGKIVEKLVICGADECTTLAGGSHEFIEGELVVAPAPLGPYYRVEVTVGAGAGAHTLTQYYLRSGGTSYLVQGNDDASNSWHSLPRGLHNGAHLYGKRTSGLAPLPTPTVSYALFDGKPVADPASYDVLVELVSAGGADYPSDPDWKTIELRSAGDNPWSSVTLQYSPGSDTVVSGAGVSFAKLSSDLARRLEAGASLDGGRSSSGFAWPLVSGWLLVAAALGSTAVLLSRRQRRARRDGP